jgi:N-acetylmuramoyl-L-alanine amidase
MNERSRTDAIIIHCTATRANQPFDVSSIRQMHLARGFSDIGYHFLIGLEGEKWEGRKPINSRGAHVANFNGTTLGVAYVGGLNNSTGIPEDTRNEKQKKALEVTLRTLVKKYPNAVILGHRDLSPDLDHDGLIEKNEWLKECPCFDAGAWAKSLGLRGARYSEGKYVLL